MVNVVHVATVVTKMEAVAHKKRVWTHHFANILYYSDKSIPLECSFCIYFRKVVLVAKRASARVGSA